MARAAVASLCLALALAAGCDDELTREHLRRGDEALAAGRYPEALAAYGHAHELAPTDARVQRGQMRARVHVMAESPARVSAEALEDIAYEAGLLLATEKGLNVVCLVAQGNVLARRGDIDGARAKLGEAIKADPQSAMAHAALGAILLGKKETQGEARAELELALKLKPDSTGPLVAIGQMKLAEGDLAGAAERFEAALRARDDVGARVGLGTVRLQQGKHAEAAVELQRAVALDPRNADALSLLGQALLGAGKLDEAARTLRAASELRRDASTSIALGFALARQKRSDEALGVFGQVLAQDANAASALYGAGIASEDMGRTEQALAFYRRLVALPTDGADRQLVAELRKEALGRVEALVPASTSSPSATPSARSPKPRH